MASHPPRSSNSLQTLSVSVCVSLSLSSTEHPSLQSKGPSIEYTMALWSFSILPTPPIGELWCDWWPQNVETEKTLHVSFLIKLQSFLCSSDLSPPFLSLEIEGKDGDLVVHQMLGGTRGLSFHSNARKVWWLLSVVCPMCQDCFLSGGAKLFPFLPSFYIPYASKSVALVTSDRVWPPLGPWDYEEIFGWGSCLGRDFISLPLHVGLDNLQG
jgi:hypothetical protein